MAYPASPPYTPVCFKDLVHDHFSACEATLALSYLHDYLQDVSIDTQMALPGPGNHVSRMAPLCLFSHIQHRIRVTISFEKYVRLFYELSLAKVSRHRILERMPAVRVSERDVPSVKNLSGRMNRVRIICRSFSQRYLGACWCILNAFDVA